MNKGLIARYHNSSGQIEEWPPQLKTAPFQSKLFISFIPIHRKRQQIVVTSFSPPRCMPLSRHERRTKTKGKKTERTLGINRGRTKTRTGDRHKVDTQNTGSEQYTQKAKGRTSKHRRTKGQKKKRPGKEDRRVSEGKTETERGSTGQPTHEHLLCLQVYQPPRLSPFEQQIRKETQANKHRWRRRKNKGSKPVERDRGQTRTKKESNMIERIREKEN